MTEKLIKTDRLSKILFIIPNKLINQSFKEI